MSLDRTLQEKLAKKYDKNLEGQLRQWMSPFFADDATTASRISDPSLPFFDLLKDGEILCLLLNKFCPGIIPTVSCGSKIAFKQVENVNSYLKACPKFGIPRRDIFTTIDLFEGKGMLMVLTNIDRLQKIHAQYGESLAEKVRSGELALSADEKQKTTTQSLRFSSSMPHASITSVLSQVQESPVRQPADVSSLDDDVAAMQYFKYDPLLERQAKKWIEDVIGEKFPEGVTFANALKSGVILCKLVNTIQPKLIPKIHTRNVPYQQMENIQAYLKACVALGVRESDLFNTVDLYENKNINLVINTIHVFGQHISKQKGYIGPLIEDGSKSRNLFSASLINQEGIYDKIEKEAYETLPLEQKELVDWFNKQLKNGFNYSQTDPNFANNLLLKSSCPPIQNLRADLIDGVQILRLLEAITKTPVISAYHRNPTTLWHCMQNASAVIRFLSAQTFSDVEGCSAIDIVTGNVREIIVLLNFIRDKFDLEYLYFKILNEEDEPTTKDSTKEESIPKTPVEFIEETEEVFVIDDEDGIQYEFVDEGVEDYIEVEDIEDEDILSSTAKGLFVDTNEENENENENEKEKEKGNETSSSFESESDENLESNKSDQEKEAIKEDDERESRESISQNEEKKPTNISEQPPKIENKENEIEPNNTEKIEKAPKIEVPDQNSTKKVEEEPTKEESSQQKSLLSPKMNNKGIPRSVSAREALSSYFAADSQFIHESDEKRKNVRLVLKSRDGLPISGIPKSPSGGTLDEYEKNSVTIIRPDGTVRRVTKESLLTRAGSIRRVHNEKQGMEPKKIMVVSKVPIKGKLRRESPVHEIDHQKLHQINERIQEEEPQTQKEQPQKNETQVKEQQIQKNEVQDQQTKEKPKENILEIPVDPKVVKAQYAVRRKIAGEILSTERNYVLHLQVLNQKFLQPVASSNLLKADELYKLSANLEEILQFHKRFLEKLQDRIGKWQDSYILSDIFLENCEYFQNYLPYMSNFGGSLLHLAFMLNKYPQLQPIFDDFEKFQSQTTRLSLESLFVMPVQRLPRYILLLKEMKKYTGKVNEKEESKLEATVDKIQNTLTDLNQKTPKGNLECVQNLQMILESVEGELHTILDPTSIYIKEGVLKLKKIQDSKKKKTQFASLKLDQYYTCFLLKHGLMICKFNDKGSKLPYKLISWIPVSDIESASHNIPSKSKSSVTIKLATDELSFHTKQIEEAKSWEKDIQMIVLENK